jgi:general secretion pathway protein G
MKRTATARRRRCRQGFTLMEVLLVLAILVIMGTIVVVNFSGVFAGSKIKVAKTQITAFKQALETYNLDMGNYPTSQQGLAALNVCPADADAAKWGQGVQRPYIKDAIPKDPWGNDYVYEFIGGDQFTVKSAGPDGQFGTTDDI